MHVRRTPHGARSSFYVHRAHRVHGATYVHTVYTVYTCSPFTSTRVHIYVVHGRPRNADVFRRTSPVLCTVLKRHQNDCTPPSHLKRRGFRGTVVGKPAVNHPHFVRQAAGCLKACGEGLQNECRRRPKKLNAHNASGGAVQTVNGKPTPRPTECHQPRRPPVSLGTRCPPALTHHAQGKAPIPWVGCRATRRGHLPTRGHGPADVLWCVLLWCGRMGVLPPTVWTRCTERCPPPHPPNGSALDMAALQIGGQCMQHCRLKTGCTPPLGLCLLHF